MPEIDVAERHHHWRPESERPSRPNSRPASIHSSTVVSASGDSPGDVLKKNTSSDDMLAMRGKRPKHYTLDSLGRLPAQALKMPEKALKEGGAAFKNAERWIMTGGKTPLGTPPEKDGMGGYFPRVLTEDERRRNEWEGEKKRRKKAKEARKKQEIFIIQHVAAILQRQQFILKLARALMM